SGRDAPRGGLRPATHGAHAEALPDRRGRRRLREHRAECARRPARADARRRVPPDRGGGGCADAAGLDFALPGRTWHVLTNTREATMTRTDAERHAEAWIRDWNARDIERVVSHYAEGARFVSPLATKRTGDPVVVGRDALRAYWSGARRHGSFRFTLEHIHW